jgi:hypothetical protein
MYGRFYALWSEPAENDGRKLRAMTSTERAEAWACLTTASEAGYVGATHALQQFYLQGSTAFGVKPDDGVAEHYTRLKAEQRAADCAAGRLTSSCSGP